MKGGRNWRGVKEVDLCLRLLARQCSVAVVVVDKRGVRLTERGPVVVALGGEHAEGPLPQQPHHKANVAELAG